MKQLLRTEVKSKRKKYFNQTIKFFLKVWIDCLKFCFEHGVEFFSVICETDDSVRKKIDRAGTRVVKPAKRSLIQLNCSKRLKLKIIRFLNKNWHFWKCLGQVYRLMSKNLRCEKLSQNFFSPSKIMSKNFKFTSLDIRSFCCLFIQIGVKRGSFFVAFEFLKKFWRYC